MNSLNRRIEKLERIVFPKPENMIVVSWINLETREEPPAELIEVCVRYLDNRKKELETMTLAEYRERSAELWKERIMVFAHLKK